MGAGELVSARAGSIDERTGVDDSFDKSTGACQFFIRNSGVIARRTFWQGSRKLQTSQRNASFADACWLVDGGLIEFRNGRLSLETESRRAL